MICVCDSQTQMSFGYASLFLALGTIPYCTINKTQNTQHTHTAQHTPHNTRWAAAALPSSGLLPSNPAETSATPPTLGAVDPYGSGDGVIRRLRSCRFSIHCFGHRNGTHRKEREGGGALALDGRRLAKLHNNQPIVGLSSGRGTGGETRPGRNVWDGAVSSIRSSK